MQTIKQLLYDEGYTISGANRKLLEDGKSGLPLFETSKPNQSKDLSKIRRDLEGVLGLLDQEI